MPVGFSPQRRGLFALNFFLLGLSIAPGRLLAQETDSLRTSPSLLMGEISPQQDQPVLTLEPVVVTAARREQRLADSPVATELITRQELEKSGAVNLADFLENQPGVVVGHSIFGSGVQLQGLGSEYVLVLVNGERALGRKGGVLDISRFAVDNVERIEVVKGNQSALYGSDAIGGVINIITRSSHAPLELDLRGDVGGAGRLDFGGSLGAGRKDWRTRFSGSFADIDVYDIEPADPETSVDGYREYSVTNQSELKLSRRAKLKAQAGYVNRDQNGVDGGTLASPAVFDRRNYTETFSASASPALTFDSDSRVKGLFQFSLFRDQYLEDQRESDELDQYQETRQRLLEGSVQYDYYRFAAHLALIGAELFDENIETERLAGGRGDRQRLGLFVQDEWGIDESRRWTLVAGLRYDRDSQFGDHVTPKLALRWDASPKLILRGSVGLGFRAPDFKELYIRFAHPAVGYEVIGNPDLEPEQSVSASLGAELRASERVWLSATVFHHDFRDLIQGILTESGDGLDEATYINVASAHITGLETTLRFQPLARLRSDLSYTWLATRDETTGGILDGRPKHRGSLLFDYSVPRFDSNLVLRGSVVGSRTFSQEYSGVETAEADPYALLDLKLSHPVGSRLSLSFGVNNLLDGGDHQYLRISPRRFFTGVDLRYRPAE